MLVQAFESDENAANSMYLDKIVTVTGTVESVTTDTTAVTVYLKESDGLAGVICSFDRKATGISALHNGMQVSIKGICTGYLMDVVMNRCSLVSGF
jgi:predicted aconitase